MGRKDRKILISLSRSHAFSKKFRKCPLFKLLAESAKGLKITKNYVFMAKIPIFPFELAQLLEKRRREHGLTQEQLAAAANVSRRTITAFVQGDTDIGLRRLTRLCIVLDLVIELHPRQLPIEEELPSIFHVEE